jgi:nuclear pore complex protein Nup155
MSFPQTTPIRPVPGAFVNTPALPSKFQSKHDPVRRQLFPVSENNPDGSQAPLGKDPAPTQAVEKAGAKDAAETKKTEENAEGAAEGADSKDSKEPENIPPLMKAAKAINTSLKADENFPELDSYCRRKSQTPT